MTPSAYNASMPDTPIMTLRKRLAANETTPLSVAAACLENANANAGRNTYITMDAEGVLREAEALQERFPDRLRRPALYGIPVSLKDCFDLAGFPTSSGSRFYAERGGPAKVDSWVVNRLKQAGTILTGKTHLHQLAYGITGENRDYGDCVQPDDARLLTGGSSSGACASVQEGSALAAIGTDTGGSVRVPAALCGLAGFRSSLGLGRWDGGAHLAQSFDTIGWIFRDLRDGPLLGKTLFDLEVLSPVVETPRIGYIDAAFLHDCDADIRAMFGTLCEVLSSTGARLTAFDAPFWADSMDIFAPIQAHEAAALHRGNFEHFEPVIAERLSWGASLSSEQLVALRSRLAAFHVEMRALWEAFDYLIVPCAPVSELRAGADNSDARRKILRYTTPLSLAGVPVVTLPQKPGGVQLIAPHGRDAELLQYAAWLSERIRPSS